MKKEITYKFTLTDNEIDQAVLTFLNLKIEPTQKVERCLTMEGFIFFIIDKEEK